MQISAEKVILTAKQHKIEELNSLALSTGFVEAISNLIHSLQAERGASSLYIASAGKRFDQNKHDIIIESQLLESRFRELLTKQITESCFANAKLLSLMAWVLLGIEDLALLRKSIHHLEVSASTSMQAYSRLISGLISLIFNLADTVIDPRISNLLVALFNLVQGKELAGQERAIGSIVFASGNIDATYQQKIVHLIENQERLFEVFCDVAEPCFIERWKEINASPATIQLEKSRVRLLSKTQTHLLDNNLSELWFTTCSERLTDMWELQCSLIRRIKEYAAILISEAETDLTNVKGLINSLRNDPPANANLTDRFFDPEIPVELSFKFVSSNLEINHSKSIIDVLQLQSKRLADMEHELESARRALTERKIIEKAKGLLMSKFSLTEEDAYKRMRSSAMEQNKKIVEVAQTIMSVSSMF
jgi:hypothetical protein